MSGIDTTPNQYDHHVWSYRLWQCLVMDLECYQRLTLRQTWPLRPYLRFNPNCWYY